MRVRPALLNPPMIAFLVIFPFFVAGIKLPELLGSWVTLLGRMATPVCMTVLGMRLATVRLSGLFKPGVAYISVVTKLLVLPAVGFCLFYFLPVEGYLKAAMYILCCCPCGAVVQSLTEIHGKGNDVAANAVLLSNILCMLTIPLLLLPVRL